MKSDTDRAPGVCASEGPAIVSRDGRAFLAGTNHTVEDLVGALARGEGLGLSPAQLELVEAAFERDPSLAG